MYSSTRQKTTSSQAGEDRQQTIYARSVAQRLRCENKRQSDREKQEQVEREAMLKFEQQLEIERQARAEEDIRREREQRESQFITERTKVRRVEDQGRRRLNEKEQQREKKREALLNIRSEGSGQAIEQQEGEHINSQLDAQGLAVCGGEMNLGGEPQSRKQLMRQQTQSRGVILDDKEYRQRVLEEKQRQTQVNNEFVNVVPVYVVSYFNNLAHNTYLGNLRLGKKKAYNDRKKAERESKNEPVQKVKSTKQVSSTRSAAQKARWASVREKKADMERMAASSDAVTVQKLDLVPKAHVRVQPETLLHKRTRMRKVVEDPFGGQYEGDEATCRARYMGSDAACGDQMGMEDEAVNVHVGS
ncbi:hypothetical protein MKW98_015654 [Papaver atlanticum]|uniref:Uncharacterized protein n=1 Tax=Papaver atlanticum TaxID=357466 RepID=A0AAD4SLN4_9MAGN|nr:hypothetical protein MKW98_015654 [Papaver atlanticum]